MDLSSSSSASTSDSCPDSSSAPSTRRIRFAPLPDPHRDLDASDPSPGDLQSDIKPPSQLVPAPSDPHGDPIALFPSVSPDSTVSSVRSTHTIRTSPTLYSLKPNLKLLRSFPFLRRADSTPNRSPLSQSASLPGSRNLSSSSLTPSSHSVPSSPSLKSAKLPHISAEQILTLGTRSLFRSRSGSASTTYPLRTSSPPPKPLGSTKSLHRSSSTRLRPVMKTDKPDWGEGSGQSHDTVAIADSGLKRRRASSSASTPGTGGGRHASSVKMLSNSPVRPSTAPGSSLAPPKKHVKMLNGRIYGGKRYAAHTLANPFANVRDEPEFVEWGYGGMGSVNASAGIANDIWKGFQRSERGGTSLAGSSHGSPFASTSPAVGAVTAGASRDGAHATIPHRKMSHNGPECGMGNVVAGGDWGDDDGSGMGWVKKRRAEREAKGRLEQEGMKNGDSMDASIYASTASTTTSLTACTSVASTDLTTPTTSPLPSRSSSVTDLKLTSSPFSESHDSLRVATGKQFQKSDASSAHPASVSKDEPEHHVLTAVHLSPSIPIPSHKHNHSATHRTPSRTLSQVAKGTDIEVTVQVPPLSPVDTKEATTSTDSSSEDEGEEPGRGSNEEEEQDDADDDEDEAQDIKRKTALGAGVEKVSRHVDVEAR